MASPSHSAQAFEQDRARKLKTNLVFWSRYPHVYNHRTFMRNPKYPNRLFIDPLKTAVRPMVLGLDQDEITVDANDDAQASSTLAQDTYWQGWKISGRTDDPNNDILVEVKSPQIGWQLMNQPIHWNNIIGTNLNPGIFAHPLFGLPNQGLQWRFIDRSGNDRQVQVSIGGRSYYYTKFEVGPTANLMSREIEGLANNRTFPFWLTTDIGEITLTQTATFEPFLMTVPLRGDFEAYAITAQSSNGAFKFSINDSFSGQFMHNSVRQSIMDSRLNTGNAEFPYLLEEPLFVGRNNRITLSIRTLAEPNTIRFTLVGRIIRNPEYD